MHNRDEMIRQAGIAAENHADGVRKALAAFLRRDPDAQSAELALRDALVALAGGFEMGSHDGATFKARVAAAKAALAAWDGPEPAYYIAVGSARLGTSDRAILHALDFGAPYSNDATRTARPSSGFSNAKVAEIATALSEGLTGEAALLRAVALVREAQSGAAPAHAEKAAADKRLHAARVERQAAILSARARGLSEEEIEHIVR